MKHRYLSSALAAVLLAQSAAGSFSIQAASEKFPAGILKEDSALADKAGQIDTVQKFLDAYAGISRQVINNGRAAESFDWFLEANADNADQIAEGRAVYLLLSPELQKQIQQAYKERSLDYDALCVKASQIIAAREQAAAKAKEEAEAQAAAKAKEEAEAQAAAKAKEEAEAQAAAKAKEEAEAQAAAKAKEEAEVEAAAKAKEEAEAQAAKAKEEVKAKEETQTPASQTETKIESNTTTQGKQEETATEKTEQPAASSADTKKETTAKKESETTALSTPAKEEAKSSDSKTEQEAANSQADKTDNKTDDKASLETDGATDTQTDSQRTVLYSTTMKGQGQLSNLDISMNITGVDASLEENHEEAVEIYLNSKGIRSYALYEDAVYSATADPDYLAASSTMLAAKTADDVVLMTVNEVADNQFTIQQYSKDALSFDFTSQNMSLAASDSQTIELSEPETAPSLSPETDTVQESVTVQEETPALSLQPDGTSQNLLLSETVEPAANEIQTAPVLQVETVSLPESAVGGITGEKEQIAAEPVREAFQMSSPVMKENTTAAVDNFIAAYCSNSAGTIYTSATTSNYRQILNGFSAWQAMSLSQRNSVNIKLRDAGSVSFQTLYRQAAQVRLSISASNIANGAGGSTLPSPIVTQPNTGSDSHQTIYCGGAILSLLMAFVCFVRSRSVSDKKNTI